MCSSVVAGCCLVMFVGIHNARTLLLVVVCCFGVDCCCGRCLLFLDAAYNLSLRVVRCSLCVVGVVCWCCLLVLFVGVVVCCSSLPFVVV